MPFATSEDGVRIHYEVGGKGAPLVLMHGTGGSGESWQRAGYVERLKDRFQCILIDSRGRGQSDYPRTQEAYDLRGRVMDIAAVLNALEVRKAHFLGYSMGGWVGWGIAIYMPQRFHALAIGGFAPASDPYFGESVEEHFGARWNKFADEEQEVVRLIHAETARFGGARQALKTTKLPILVYAGDQDPRFASVLGAGQLGPTASFFQLPGKDHGQAFADEDAVETVSAKVAEFFAGVPTEA
jgi:pimeloyl-ACP methyl ester carboxylesterase